ncbi:MAG: AMP-binding protein [Magnetococcales bacterium]|nr:AMP-binding protein [Magnetococcales bacterium]
MKERMHFSMTNQFFSRLKQNPNAPLCHIVQADNEIDTIGSGAFLVACQRWAGLISTSDDAIIPIFGRMTHEMLAAWFGVILAGRLPTFISYPSRKISPEAYTEKLSNYQHHFNNKIFIGETQDRRLTPHLFTPEDAIQATPYDAPYVPPDPDAPLFIQCSSGTTGLQKAVAITSRQLEAQLTAYSASLKLDPSKDRIASWLPLYHDMGLIATYLLPLLSGTHVTYLDPFQWADRPGILLETISQQRLTLCWMPNFAFAFLCRAPAKYDLSSIRAFINCAEPVTLEAQRDFMRHHRLKPQQLAISYAMAENVFAVTQTALGQPPSWLELDPFAIQRRQVQPQGPKRQLDDSDSTAAPTSNTPNTNTPPPMCIFSCGPLLENLEARIETRPGTTVGEIFLRGPSVIPHYHNADPLRDDGWFPSGDLGFFYEGELYVSGRIKDLIIHNGKNIYPQDLEQSVNQHPAVHSGRTAACGDVDPKSGSENIRLFFEPENPLLPEQRESLCREIRLALSLRFDIQCRVICVPRGWIRKTSSGKVNRRANLETYHKARNQMVHIIGDSHTRIFWQDPHSHRNTFHHIRGYWAGVIWSENWQHALKHFEQIIPTLRPRDILILEAGEPECRTIFAVDPDPADRIMKTLESYGRFLVTLRQMWPGRLAYMTGPPTHPENIDNGDKTWPITGTPEDRYRWQTMFYQGMQQLCEQLTVYFIDACTPLLGPDGKLPLEALADLAHLKPELYRPRYIEWLERPFGYINLEPEATQGSQTTAWDGHPENFPADAMRGLKNILLTEGEPDLEHLVSSGALDSLGMVALITFLETAFGWQIPLHRITRDDFESLPALYQRFGPGKSD